MAFQLSIGDGILLAQIAWRLAQTFTKGRQSAPAEFQEVENELYSLSAALTAAQTQRESITAADTAASSINPDSLADNPQTAQVVFEHVIANCSKTLTHLEDIVKKYLIVSEPTDPTRSKLERWNHHIAKNWKKVEWTTEKGDLSTLRSQIQVHVNSLNLLVSIGTSSRTASIERSLDKKLVLLEELHQWYVENLKDNTPKNTSSPGSLARIPQRTDRSRSSNIISTFEIAKETDFGTETICPCASLSSKWVESFLSPTTLNASSEFMFLCSCLDRRVGTVSHQFTVQRYGLSHLIFPVRIASDDGAWILYKTADITNNQLVNLYIRKIHPSYIRHLEDTFFHVLASRRGEAILAQGAGNHLCYVAPDSQEERILTSLSDLKISQTSVESITFRSGRTQHVRELVDDVQILQYDAFNSRTAVEERQVNVTRLLDYAEVLVSFDVNEAQERGDVISTILKLRRNTVINLTETASVDITSIEAIGTHSDERISTLSRLDVTIQFTTKAAAKEFHEKIESMRKELFVRSLQYPRPNERVMLNLQAARVECETLYIDDADITIAVDTDGKYRLIIVSRNRCTIMSQVLAEDFFTTPAQRPNYTGSTYLVQVEDTGERKVYHYKNGFRHLSLSTAQANRMLELARNSISLGMHDGEEDHRTRPGDQA
ncbi:hypothetical protein F5Y19DRAFT_447498 [Xylariaceae sp. FL1651]|nr:hypothetical protein F5Y19DRAFT_447498 [Xylariaceae sp. FL1651]